MTPKWWTLLIVASVVLVVDQASKAWIVASLDRFGEPWPVIDGFFYLTHARNPAAALGLARDVPSWVFVGLMVLALVLILSFLRQIDGRDKLSATSLSLIVGGALGNLLDRVRLGEVVDFLHFDLGLFVFPDFNVADSAIVVGVALLLLDVVVHEAEKSAEVAAEVAVPDEEAAEERS